MKITTKIAAVLALIIGAMAIVAGGKVLLGQMPDYYVINWLPVYNYSAGLLTVTVTAVLLWINHRYARLAAFTTFVVHAVVMLILQTGYRDVVASDSIRAMTVRLVAWTIILGLLYIPATKRSKQLAAS